jgi:group I intron endonuclease
MKYIVYKITNKVNGKIYIGQTQRTLEQRWNSHVISARNENKFRFHHAIKFHGKENFEKEILHESESYNEICLLEIKEIKKHNSNHPKNGYNATAGGTGGWMIPRLSEERQKDWKEKISFAVSGEKNPNCIDIANEDLISLLSEYYDKYGYICGLLSFIGYGMERGIKIPKSFQKYRFNGDYGELANIVAKLKNTNYNPYERRKEFRDISAKYKKIAQGKQNGT